MIKYSDSKKHILNLTLFDTLWDLILIKMVQDNYTDICIKLNIYQDGYTENEITSTIQLIMTQLILKMYYPVRHDNTFFIFMHYHG